MKRTVSQGAFWTAEEDAALMPYLDAATVISKEVAAMFPGRTPKGVRNRASKLRAMHGIIPTTGGAKPDMDERMSEARSARACRKLAAAMIKLYNKKATAEGISLHHAMIRCNFNPLVVALHEKKLAA